MSQNERVILFSAPDGSAAVEVFLSPEGQRLDAVVLYASDRVKLLRFPHSAAPSCTVHDDETAPGDAPTWSGDATEA